MKSVIGAAAAVAVFAAVTVAIAPRWANAQGQPRLVMRTPATSSWIGVGIRDVTADDATAARLASPAGVYIASVAADSPAARAGFQTGDIVVELDGERVRSAAQFMRLVQESAPTRQISAVVVRSTSKQTLNVTPEPSNRVTTVLSDRVQQDLGDLARQMPQLNVDPQALRRLRPLTGVGLGVTVTPLTDQLAGYFGVKQGVLVTAVTSSSPAAEAGVRAGDVITAINGQNVANAADVTRVVRQARIGGTLEIAVTRDKQTVTLKATVPGPSPQPSGRGGIPV